MCVCVCVVSVCVVCLFAALWLTCDDDIEETKKNLFFFRYIFSSLRDSPIGRFVISGIVNSIVCVQLVFGAVVWLRLQDLKNELLGTLLVIAGRNRT